MKEELSKVLNGLDGIKKNLRELNNYTSISDFLKDLSKYENKLKKYYEKFEKNLIEIAISGPEKAGKSAFANALIGKELLPSKKERATYITTMVVYGKEPKVEIEFYTEEEFNNYVLQTLLKGAGFENYHKFTIDNVEELKGELEEIKEQNPKFYDLLKSKRYDKEIEEIINNKEKILEHLGSERKEFVNKDASMSNYDKYITDKGISRAVKHIKIYTPTLEKIPNVILYDLPGFDSPTVIHSEFTERMLKEVDAIIYLRKFSEPSLKGHELDIFDKVKEEDGLAVKEKLFFFLTQVDTAKTKEEIDETIEKFVKDLKEWNLFRSKQMIVAGSALAYMAKKKIVNTREAQRALEDLEKLGVSDGIEELLNRLEEYNRTERRRILEDRVKTVLKNLKIFLERVYTEVSDLSQKDETVRALEMKDRIKEKLKEVNQNLDSYINEIMEELRKNKELSNMILEKYRVNLTMIDEKRRKALMLKVRSGTYTPSEKVERYNQSVREELIKEINEKIHKLPEEVVINKQNEVKEKVIEIVLDTFKPDKRQEFREKLSSFIDENLKNYLSEIYGIKVVFLRFIGGFMELLITYPKSSTDRLRAFHDIMDDIVLVSSAFSKDNEQNPLLAVSLSPENMSEEELKEEILSRIRWGIMDIPNPLEKNRIKNALDTLPVHKLRELYLRLKQNEEKVSVDEFEKIVARVKVEETVSMDMEGNKHKKPSEYLREFLEKKKKELEKQKDLINQTIEDADREIEKDLEDFKNIIERVLIHAINPEKTFEIVVKDFVNKLKEILAGKEGDKFFNENLKLIYYTEFQKMDNIKEMVHLAKEISDKITNLTNLIEEINTVLKK